ncbi:MAG: hypothetical protein EP329_18235 [Deltaproteobacteria bacterium]|nr:MAG: hypothetical protein EP329_18235 [Deltaproteobacteria bacterium]
MKRPAPLVFVLVLALVLLGLAGCLEESGGDGDATADTADGVDTVDVVAPSCDEATPGGVCAGAGTCEIGQECCCGQCYPSTVCDCRDGAWACYATDACMIPGCGDTDEPDVSDAQDVDDVDEPEDVVGACPASEPLGDSCATDGLHCDYGQECCCGQCYPSISCTCAGGTWACLATDACFSPSCPDGGGDTASGACDDAATSLAATLYVKPQAFTVVVRLDHDSRAVLGYSVVPGAYAAVTEAEARAAAQEATGFGAAGTLLSGAAPADAWVFYEAPGDFGGVGVVSARTGLAVFGGGIVWDGTGDITWPTAWSPAENLASGCDPTSGGFGTTRGFDLVSGGVLDAEAVGAALDVVADTALPAAIWQGGYVFDAVVLRYPRSVGLFDPTSAEWIVLVSGGWLE